MEMILHDPLNVPQQALNRASYCETVPALLLRLYAGKCVCYNVDRTSSIKIPLDNTTTFHPRVPLPRYEKQDEIFSSAFEILGEAIEKQAFPGATAAVTLRDELIALKALGRFTYDPASQPVQVDAIFDLASVTKVVATTSMAMVLYERGLLDLEAPVLGVVPEFRGEDPRRGQVTFRHLLAHSSGLPAYEKLFLRANTRDELLKEAFSVPLRHGPGTSVEYSDIGFIVLGVALERIAGEGLDHFCQREIFGPLGMSHTAYNPPIAWKTSIPPTANDQTFRHRIIQAEVQDENASLMGGVAPHAGVFSSASDVAIFAHAMLNGGAPISRAQALALFIQRQDSPAGTSRALGWDTPSVPSQSGKYFSPLSFGHLGYTGTSLWIDPERRISVTLLSNRTWPDCENKTISQIRPQFHDAVMQALGVTA
jgi:serine-type D-Ala-D-Ala carboxypeptidase